ncbi:MAG: hypothetical protein H0X41_08730, partial [Chitinophagaceae bacterium]|nr:hypothetical protein [Chitinophagaceae bacterium]
MKSNKLFLVWALVIVFIALRSTACAQSELAPWGNMTGIRIDGQLMEFETSISVVTDWSSIKSTGKEKQRPHYMRKGTEQTVITSIDSLTFTETVADSETGSAKLNVQVSARDDASGDIYLAIGVLEKYYSNGSLQADNLKPQLCSSGVDQLNKYAGATMHLLRFISARQQLLLHFDEPTAVVIRNEAGHLRFYVPIHAGKLSKGGGAQKNIRITASGIIDKSPVSLRVNTTKQGREFIGFGGNFRLQNPKADTQVIDYCLENMRVAFGRVEMPWRFWQPEKAGNPIDSAKTGKLHPAVEHAMLMAQRLSKKNIPVILSAWSAPAWAVIGKPKFGPGPDGVWGNPLNGDNMQEIYKSIADYITYLRDQYKVEVGYFSFNESDLGINIRQTGEEHAALIKGLGSYFEKAGLKTKLLLGDNSDATTYEFIYPALKDSSTHKYIGAVSFHSWRGWEKETLQKWADAATKLNLPLIVAEGSIDAQAWGYPAIFEEPVYAREEINLYTRLLAICQPAAILQWQLTSDYSPLSGGGVFGNYSDSLHPTQRFWNLKQLASTPAGLKYIDAVSDKDLVTIA